MSGFSESLLEKKLVELNASAQSIQQCSLWIIHQRKHLQTIVKVWFREMSRVAHHKKLTFLYLANDVVQNSRKKCPEFAKQFGSVMKKVLEHLAGLTLDEKTVKSIGRLLKIWKERTIFDPKIQTDLDRIWGTKSLEVAGDDQEPPVKKAKIPESPKVKKKVRVVSVSKEELKADLQEAIGVDIYDSGGLNTTSSSDGNASQNASSGDLLNSLLSPSSSPDGAGITRADPPDPEELMKALQELENAASSDAVVREKIAKLPPEVSEVSHLASLKTPQEGQHLLSQVDEATELLNKYNDRLQQELKERKKVAKMIADFLAAQKDLETQAEERVEQYREKLDKVNTVRDDLKLHIQSLPDLTQLPDVTAGSLAPLPSAGDLFTLK